MNGESRPKAASATLTPQDIAASGSQLGLNIGCADDTSHHGITCCWECGWNSTNGPLPFGAES
jgi:hypothetical protein